MRLRDPPPTSPFEEFRKPSPHHDIGCSLGCSLGFGLGLGFDFEVSVEAVRDSDNVRLNQAGVRQGFECPGRAANASAGWNESLIFDFKES